MVGIREWMLIMDKLFKKLPADKKKSIRYEIRLTEIEAEEIRASALARNLSVADFMRRAALARRADNKFETEIVLALRDVVMVIRSWHAAFVEHGVTPPQDSLGAIVDAALNTMLRIEK